MPSPLVLLPYRSADIEEDLSLTLNKIEGLKHMWSHFGVVFHAQSNGVVTVCGKVCQAVATCCKVWQDVSRSVKLCYGVSRCIKMCQGVSRCLKVSQLV